MTVASNRAQSRNLFWAQSNVLIPPRRVPVEQVVLASNSLPYAKNPREWPHRSESLNPRDSLLLILSNIDLHFIIDREQTCSRVSLSQIIIPLSVI